MPAKTTKTPARSRRTGVTAKPAKTGYEWPKPAAKILLDYLKAEVTDTADAPNRAKPFINANGVLHLHSSDWREWLTANGMPMTKAEAAAPLRDAGLKVRAFPLPGENRSLGFYVGEAPKGTEKLARRQPQRAVAKPRNPLAKLTDEQAAYLEAVLAANEPRSEQRAAHGALVGYLKTRAA